MCEELGEEELPWHLRPVNCVIKAGAPCPETWHMTWIWKCGSAPSAMPESSPREQAAAQPAEKPQVRRIARTQVRQRQHLSVLSVVGFGAVTALAILVLMSYIQLTALSADMVSLQSELEELETENVSLTAQHEELFDLDTVKETAEAAGMSKPSSSQIYYVDLSDGDSAVVYQQEEPGILSRLLTSLNHGIYAVVEYFE